MTSAGGQKIKVKHLQVGSVQTVAAAFCDSEELPERYIQPQVAADVVIHVRNSELPVIDLARLLDPQSSKEETAKLGAACADWGFFQLINHGADVSVISQIRQVTKEFFSLPPEDKKAVAIAPDGGLEGYGQHWVMSEHQKVDWNDTLYLITRPIEQRHVKFWPTKPPTFRDALDKYSLELANVTRQLLECMAKNLEIEAHALVNAFKDLPQSIKMIYYPPCRQAEKVMGLSAHTDSAAGLTLVLNANDVAGLQIKKNGEWLSVEAVPGAFIVNIGDVLEIMTNGKYRSVEHRAVVNPAKERISIAAFHGPSLSGTVGPLPEIVKGGKELFRSYTNAEYARAFFSVKLDGRSLVERSRLSSSNCA